jgi:hypothetical protein
MAWALLRGVGRHDTIPDSVMPANLTPEHKVAEAPFRKAPEPGQAQPRMKALAAV